jgi:hypothetical protein
MSDERAYFVILKKGGRMYPCRHNHTTREEADTCVAEHGGLAIIEWVRDRRPQFTFPWMKKDLDDKALAFIERFN